MLQVVAAHAAYSHRGQGGRPLNYVVRGREAPSSKAI